MDSGAHKLLESATQRTLHAHSFSRTSSQASLVLTDLFSRYLSLLSSTCAKYATHAGRTRLTAWDAERALDELGVSVEELSEFYQVEGQELGRYAIQSARRVEDLNEFRVQLSEGLRQDDDVFPLAYRPFDPSMLDEELEAEEEDVDWEHENSDVNDVEANIDVAMDGLDAELELAATNPLKRPAPRTPPLPLSPISNPSSPARKRARTLDWEPPDHVPDFLPPFPKTRASPTPEPSTPAFEPQLLLPPSVPADLSTIDQISASMNQAVTSAAASDFLVQVPYNQSSLSSVPEWHIPTEPHAFSAPPSRMSRYATPQTEPTLLAAYHHILTHPPPQSVNTANPARHKVAMQLLNLIQTESRWDPPDTLYSNTAPNAPRVNSNSPTYPIATAPNQNDVKFPASTRPVYPKEQVSYLVGRQFSRIPDLAQRVLPSTIFSRTTRLAHPPVLLRQNQPCTYGPGIPAYWNSGESTPAEQQQQKPVNGVVAKDKPKGPALPDARLYATWQFETKDYRTPLAITSNRTRGRMNSVQSPAISFGGRERRASKAG